MNDRKKTKAQLIQELTQLRGQLNAGQTNDMHLQDEEALRQSEARYRTLAETTPDIVYVVDKTGRLLYGNQTAAAYMGLSPTELVGKTQHDLFPPEVAQRHIERIRQLFATGQAGEADEAYRFGPHEVWLNVRSIPIRDQRGGVSAMLGVCRNITERKRAEEALKASEERFRKIVEDGPLGVVLLGSDGQIQHANRQFCEMLGYTENESIDLGITGVTHPDDCEISRSLSSRLLRGEIPHYSAEKRYVSKAGRTIWAQLTVSVMHDSAGRPTMAIGMIQDITRRRLSADALRASEAKYRRLHETMRDAFVSVDMDGWVQEHNEAYRAMLGYEPEELRTLRYFDITPEKWHAFEARIVQEQILSRGYSDIYEKEYRRKDGSVFPVELRVFLLRDGDGGASGMWAIVRDISERKQAQEALRQSEQRLSLHFQQTPLAAIEWDTEGKVAKWNPSAEQIFGYTQEEAIGRPFTFITPPSAREYVEHLAADLRHQKGGQRSTNKNVTKDGRTILCEWYNTPLVDANGLVVGAASLALDITQRTRAEEALRQARDELEHKVQERTSELAIFRKFAEASGRGFGMADMNGTITYANPTLCEMFGEAGPDDVIGRHVVEYYPADYRNRREKEILPALLRDGSWQGEQEILSRNGKLIPTLQNSFLIRDEKGQPFRLAVCVADISELTRAQEALRASEARYRGVVEDQTEVICRFTADGAFTFVNDVFCRFFGKTSQELVGQKWQPLPVADDVPMIEEQLGRMSPEHPVIVVENRVYAGNGEVRWMQFVNRGFFDAAGRLTEIQAVGRDITDRKQAQEALRASEEKYRTLVETSPDGVVMADLTGRITYVSERVLAMHGAAGAEDLFGRNPLDFLLPSEHQRFLADFAELLEKGLKRDVEYTLLRKDGTQFAGEISAAVVRDTAGWPSAVVAVFRDVTERKRAQEELRQSHDEVQAIYGGLRDGLLIADSQTRGFVQTNPVMCEMLGYSTQELLALRMDDIHPPESLEYVRLQFQEIVAGSRWIAENIPILRRNGTVFYTDIAGNRLNYRGRPCVIGFFRDVTERYQAREALERERQSLWRMLQASDHERQIISYEIHDGLAQYLAAAQMQFQSHDSLKHQHPDEARKAYETALELVRQAHFEARRLISEVRPPVIDEIGLETAISHLVYEQRRHGSARIDYHSNVQFERLLPILENSLYRIAQEALNNACQHSKSQSVSVALEQDGREVRLEVRDWGVGFDPAAVEKGHFGLEGIRQRVRLLGGRLSVASTPGAGTTVEVAVPILEQLPDE